MNRKTLHDLINEACVLNAVLDGSSKNGEEKLEAAKERSEKILQLCVQLREEQRQQQQQHEETTV